jgi:hypothetical protein
MFARSLRVFRECGGAASAAVLLLMMPAQALKYVISMDFGGGDFFSIAVSFVLNLLLLLTVLFGYMAAMKIVDEHISGRAMGLNAAFSCAIELWPCAAWTLLLMALLTLLGGPPAFLIADYFHLGKQVFLNLLLPLCVMLPALSISVLCIFAFNAVLEGKSGFGALSRSFSLVRRGPLKVLGGVALFLVISFVIAFLVALPVVVLLKPLMQDSELRSVFYRAFAGSAIISFQIALTTLIFRELSGSAPDRER